MEGLAFRSLEAWSRGLESNQRPDDYELSNPAPSILILARLIFPCSASFGHVPPRNLQRNLQRDIWTCMRLTIARN